ncbi:hypothetical protein [Thiohalocapsa sp. ML1]|jgi:hypothetical protein|uniref:hypothetical protein n=1 Tax=Thiohalocapsa sp. ML1 TaxID=1431688 RepID=UPI0007323B3E|nr:hypothetical protein [Thiohalocapsa sp. ML1]
MFVFDIAAIPAAPARPADHAPLRLRPLGWLRALDAQRRLLRRQRALARPAGWHWVPTRTWRRHSALICLAAGIDPDAETRRPAL